MNSPRQYCKSALIGALACGVLVFVASAAGQTQRDAQARGKQLYFQHGCYGCHGFNGETGNAPHLVDNPILANAQLFITFLRARAGYRPLLPSTSMPSFSASDLSDADALDLYSYVDAFVLHAPDPQGIEAFQKIFESAKDGDRTSP